MKTKFKEFLLINAIFMFILLIVYLFISLFTLDLQWFMKLSDMARGFSLICICLCYCVMFGVMEN